MEYLSDFDYRNQYFIAYFYGSASVYGLYLIALRLNLCIKRN